MAKNKGARRDLEEDQRRIVLSMCVEELHISPRYCSALKKRFETVGELIAYLESRDDGPYSGLYQINRLGEFAAVAILLELFSLGVLRSKMLRSIPQEVLDRYQFSLIPNV